MYAIDNEKRVCQGDLYRNLLFLEFINTEGNKFKLNYKSMPYVLIISQECDLKWDYEGHDGDKIKHNQFINSVLCCPAYPATDLRKGEHLFEIKGNDHKMRQFGKADSTSWKQVKQNSEPRYHHLKRNKVDEIVIPELVVDFKHHYSIPRDLFYHYREQAEYLARLDVPFREFVSQRFAYFLSRIGLPELETKKIDCDSDPCRAD